MSSHIITIKESPKLQTRIQVSMFKGRKFVDVRRFFKADGADWAPTKKGISVSPEHVDALIDALKKIKPSAIDAPAQVATGEEVVKYVMATSAENAKFQKKLVFDSLEEAEGKPFPKTMAQEVRMSYKIFKVLIRDGAVVRHKTERIRRGTGWVPPLKATEKTAAAKTTAQRK